MSTFLINEQQWRKILSEGKKEDILVNKIGLSEQDAAEVVRICGALSIWMVKKMIQFYADSLQRVRKDDPNVESILADIKGSLVPSLFKRSLNIIGELPPIMDFIRVGLDGNVSSIKHLNFVELQEASKKWHDELKIGGDKIDYVEEGNILVDLRDENGIGFYWVDLETSNSKEECNRMGHCGNTSYGNTIISLREYKAIGDKHTRNKSHLTAAVGQGINNDGVIHQLKGPKNQKPEQKYNPLIMALLMSEDADITGFEPEYNSGADFELNDLSKEEVETLFSAKPEIFKTRRDKKTLMDYGLIEPVTYNYKFTLKLTPSEITSYINGDYKTSRGGSFFEALLVDPWDVVGYYDYGGDSWKYIYDDIDDVNMKVIDNLIQDHIKENDINDEEIEDLEGVELLEYIDHSELISAISIAVNDATNDAYVKAYQKALKEALEELGTVSEFTYEGVTIQMDVESEFNTIERNDPTYFDEVAENCDDDPECMHYEFLSEEVIDKPEYSYNDHYGPGVDSTNFNEHLRERLGEL